MPPSQPLDFAAGAWFELRHFGFSYTSVDSFNFPQRFRLQIRRPLVRGVTWRVLNLGDPSLERVEGYLHMTRSDAWVTQSPSGSSFPDQRRQIQPHYRHRSAAVEDKDASCCWRSSAPGMHTFPNTSGSMTAPVLALTMPGVGYLQQRTRGAQSDSAASAPYLVSGAGEAGRPNGWEGINKFTNPVQGTASSIAGRLSPRGTATNGRPSIVRLKPPASRSPD